MKPDPQNIVHNNPDQTTITLTTQQKKQTETDLEKIANTLGNDENLTNNQYTDLLKAIDRLYETLGLNQ